MVWIVAGSIALLLGLATSSVLIPVNKMLFTSIDYHVSTSGIHQVLFHLYFMLPPLLAALRFTAYREGSFWRFPISFIYQIVLAIIAQLLLRIYANFLTEEQSVLIPAYVGYHTVFHLIPWVGTTLLTVGNIGTYLRLVNRRKVGDLNSDVID